MLLADYRTNTRDILKDPNANFYSVAQVDRWINRARKQVAQKGRCVRRLPPGSGSITSITVNSGGSGYISATVTISEPDSPALGNVQATASVTVLAGAVTGFVITEAGAGYIAPPTITIEGSGTGAMGTAVLSAHVNTVPNQEVYPLSAIASAFGELEDGMGNLIGIQSISVGWGSFKPTLAPESFSYLQAYCRSATMTYTGWPRVWAPYGQGASGSFYLFPIPSQYSLMEVDCYFDVLDLSASQTVDVIPEPWCESVYYYAAYLAYLNAQRYDDSARMLGEHNRLMAEARAAVSPDSVPLPYGEW